MSETDFQETQEIVHDAIVEAHNHALGYAAQVAETFKITHPHLSRTIDEIAEAIRSLKQSP